MAAISTTGLSMSNYQLGEPLGKGASANVFKALNWTTGETVAIKQIHLADIPANELGDIMSEIDLLKNLNHVNIVKYKGFFKTSEFLYIILEYCENGSLQTILKRYGKFPEDLVAVYISQVLEGLIYLHSQGVIHRDIKGANILTNKDGGVKLADFGVSTMMPGVVGLDGELVKKSGEEDMNVVGSPYWMAPEVIEQNGATTASDIWSVGCVIIELLEGKPPYHALEPLQALFRVVQDDKPPIPDSVSPIVKDFLYQCFQKDPNLRVSAKKLLKHPWMTSMRKQMEDSKAKEVGRSRPPTPIPQEESDEIFPTGSDENLASRPRLTASQSKPSDLQRDQKMNKGIAYTVNSKARERATIDLVDKDVQGTIKNMPRRPLTTVYDQAVQRVQEWNEALNAPGPSSHKKLRRVPNTFEKPLPKPPGRTNEVAASSCGESFAAHMRSISAAGKAPRSILSNSEIVFGLRQAEDKPNDASVWDDDFVEGPDLYSKLKKGRPGDNNTGDHHDKMRTIMPTRSPSGSPIISSAASPGPIRPLPMIRKESSDEDCFDIADVTDADFSQKVAGLRKRTTSHRGLYHPDDIRSHGLPSVLESPSMRRKASGGSSRSSLVQQSPTLVSPGLSRSPSFQSSVKTMSQEEAEKVAGLQKYAEQDEEDYDDVFVPSGWSVGGPHTTNDILKLNTRRSDRSWHDEDEDDSLDPFAEMEDTFEENDVETNLIRDKQAMLSSTINEAIEQLRPDANEDALTEAGENLLSLLEGDNDLQNHFVNTHGLLAVLEVLEARPSRDVILMLLRIINMIVVNDAALLESCCHVGGIPVVMTFTSKKYSLDIRLEASTFVRCLSSSALTLQMFISCRGLRVLVELLDEDYGLNKDLVLSALEGIGSVFELQSATPRNDFCRMFIREGISDPLSTALINITKDSSPALTQAKFQVVTIMFLFCQMSQSDARVREAFGSRGFIIRLLRSCDSLPNELLLTGVKAIKHLSTSPKLLDVLQNSDAIAFLVRLLRDHLHGASGNEICSQIFQSLFNLCRLSRSRQEEAAQAGVVPLLQRVIRDSSPLKEFALPILCDLASAGKATRRLLWKADGLGAYLNLLLDAYWRVSALEAIFIWLQDETARVEDTLLEKASVDLLLACFTKATGVSFEGILEPLLKIMRISPPITRAMAQPPLFKRLVEGLGRKSKPGTKLHLLRIVRVVCENHPERANLVEKFGLSAVIEQLGRQDDAVLVRELAKEIAPTLLPSATPPKAIRPDLKAEIRQGVRRAMSDIPMVALGPKPASVPDRERKQKRRISRNKLNDIHWTEKDGQNVPVRRPTTNQP